jgi:outer membrane receptor for ferrienterochelin and colicins
MKRFSTIFTAGLFIFCGENTVFAQKTTDSLQQNALGTVTVNALFVPTDAKQSVNTVRVISRKTIEQRGANNLEELLQTEATIRLSQDATLGSTLGINGLRGENVKILIDGVPVAGRLNGSIDAGQLPLGTVQQVEIIEGAQSLLYGSEASAGVINLVTRKTQAHKVEAEANTQWETSGFRNLQGRAGVGMGKFSLQFSGNQLDFKPQPDTTLGRDQIWNPKTQRTGRAILRFSPSDRLDIRLSGSVFEEKVDNLGELRRPKYKPYAFDDYYYTNRKDIALHTEGWLPKRLFWQLTSAYNTFGRVKNSYRTDFPYKNSEETTKLIDGQQDTSGASGLLTRAILSSDRKDRKWNFLFGVDNYAETATGTKILDSTGLKPGLAQNSDWGFIGSIKFVLNNKLTMQSGMRWTENRLYGSVATPSYWLLWQPKKNIQCRVSYANGFRSPALKELYFNFIDVNHFVVGNTNLRPERSNNLRAEATWQYKTTKNMAYSLTAAGFYNYIQNRIILAEFEPTKYSYKNLNIWETQGGSIAVNVGIKEVVRFKTQLVATGFYNNYNLNNSDLPRLNWSSDWVNEVSANIWKDRIGCTVWHKYTGNTPYFFESKGEVVQGTTADWHLLNAAINGSFCKNNIKINAGVKNILDTRQIRSGASDATHSSGSDLRPVHWGRTYFVGLICTLHTKS